MLLLERLMTSLTSLALLRLAAQSGRGVVDTLGDANGLHIADGHVFSLSCL
jgi:hypothetical protein